jgi:hypothetical protein
MYFRSSSLTPEAWKEKVYQCTRPTTKSGSGANARVAGDDEEMQQGVPIEDLFKGRHFDGQIIILCVAWYTSFKLSLRDLVIMMADRGISMTHTTILRWIQRYLPEFEKRWWRYARPVGGSWRMDETYIKVHGHWQYLYRAVERAGQTVDFFLSPNRDVNAAKSFLRSAMKNTTARRNRRRNERRDYAQYGPQNLPPVPHLKFSTNIRSLPGS